ncbi:MAG TPA: PH domain-containing protein [Thermoplasmata archaeon]
MANRPKHIPAKFLSSDEHIVFEARPSGWLFMKAAFMASVIGLAALILLMWELDPDTPDIPYFSEFVQGDYGVYIQIALGAIVFLCMFLFYVRWMRWTSTVYAVTDERLITQKGILNKRYEDVAVTMVTNVEMAQSLGKRALGYGTLVISTQGAAGKNTAMIWEGIPDPLTVRRKIQEVMDIRVKPGQDKPR